MASNSPEPSSSTKDASVAASGEVQSLCDEPYENEESNIAFQGESFTNQFKTDLQPVVSYAQFSIDPCSSSGTYAQVSLPSYSTVNHVSTSNQNSYSSPSNGNLPEQDVFISSGDKRISIESMPVSQMLQEQHSNIINSVPNSPSTSGNDLHLHEDSTGVHQSHVQDVKDVLEPVSLSVDHLNLQQVSIVHPSLGNLPIILDRNNVAALLSSSRDGSLTLDISNLPRSILSSQNFNLRTVVIPENTQLINHDTAISENMLSSMITSTSTSSSTATSSSGVSFPINHKQMLAQKYAAEMLCPTTSTSLISDQQFIDSISDRASTSFAETSSSSLMQSSSNITVFGEPSSLPSTSASQCLPMDVYSMDRNVGLVTSSRDSPDNVINENDFQNVAGLSHHQSVKNYVSSSVDLVHSHQMDHGMHCTVDSTVGPKLHHNDENIVDSSEGYNSHLGSPDNILHTTSRVEDLHSSAVSSATHPDSTRSPVGVSECSSYNMSVVSMPSSSDMINSHYSRPRRDVRGNRHWCEDCGIFYDKECALHRIQLIFDKPVLSRAWASLPAQYLFVNKIALDNDGDPVYGVFAKKTIPKRTQFGPIEGVLVKREDPPSDHFILVIEHEDNVPLYLDTSDESMSNWMRFVRPADSYKEQNLVLVQQGNSLYFNTIRSITPKLELRVWYSAAYAHKWGLPVLEPDEEERKALQEQENEWPCFECNERFAASVDLQKHLNQHEVHTVGSPKNKNKARARAKLSKKVLTARLRLPAKQEEFKCEICYKSFPRNYSLQRHLIMHTGEKKYKCPICDIKFSHVYNRNRHVRRHKRDDSEPHVIKPAKSLFKKKHGAEWVCTHCGLTFDNSSVLNLHILTHAAEDVIFNDEHAFLEASIIGEDGFDNSNESKLDLEESNKCPECTEGFASRRDLIEHTSVHGKIGKQRCYRGIINPLKPYKCNLCYKSFASDERLIRHYLVHGSEDSKPLQCDICYKRFLNNSALACHIKVHSEERKFYECPICKIEFDQIVALKEHVHIHCENGVYNCPGCHKIFEEYNQVRKHIRAFHSERRYPCDKCDKIFPRPDKLKLHMLRHSDHREFLCANCGKQFKRKDKLKEHMKRMHAPDREARVAAKNNKASQSKKFVPKVSPTDYHRFIYKCHTCLLGFKRRGMLVNHLAKRHPDIRPESVPELNLPILKTTRDYYCQYCEKVYKSSSKRKAHILKNHPGSELPMSNRRKGGVPEIPGLPNPTFSQTVGSITTHPHHCNWCHKQYASKAKLLQHQRKKHVDMLTLSYVANTTKVEPVCDQSTQVADQIVVESISNTFSKEAAVLIDATQRKIHYVDKDSLVVTHPDGIPTADLLTQAMSELTQNFSEYRSATGEFLVTRLTPSMSPPATPIRSSSSSPVTTIVDTNLTPTQLSQILQINKAEQIQLDQLQLNQVLAQYQQNATLSPQQLAVVVTSVSKSWPTAITTGLGNYPAR